MYNFDKLVIMEHTENELVAYESVSIVGKCQVIDQVNSLHRVTADLD